MEGKEIICIDGGFTSDQIAFWTYHKVVWPEEGKMYAIRSIISNSNGDTGFLLEELVNPKIPIQHPILGVTMIEPYWHIRRFSHLNGDLITQEEAKEMDREYNLTKNLNF